MKNRSTRVRPPVVGPFGPREGVRGGGRSADRTRATAPNEPNSPRRMNPIPAPSEPERPPFVRLRAAQVAHPPARARLHCPSPRAERTGRPAERTQFPVPNEPNSPRRTNPIPGAERTQSLAERTRACDSVRHGAGMPDLEPPITNLSKSIPYHRESGPPRSPNPQGCDVASPSREAGPQTDPRPNLDGRHRNRRRSPIPLGSSEKEETIPVFSCYRPYLLPILTKLPDH
jgi:hypothetical protein